MFACTVKSTPEQDPQCMCYILLVYPSACVIWCMCTLVHVQCMFVYMIKSTPVQDPQCMWCIMLVYPSTCVMYVSIYSKKYPEHGTPSACATVCKHCWLLDDSQKDKWPKFYVTHSLDLMYLIFYLLWLFFGLLCYCIKWNKVKFNYPFFRFCGVKTQSPFPQTLHTTQLSCAMKGHSY